MASFATPADFQLYYDLRRLKDLSSDSGTPTTDITSNPVILAALARATEMLLSAVNVGKKYSVDELQTLVNSGTNGRMVVGLVCDLAYGLLVMRRGTGAADLDRLSPSFKAAQYTLTQLEAGVLVFPLIDGSQHEDAGTPRTTDLRTLPTSPSIRSSWSAQAGIHIIPNSPVTNPYGGWIN